MKPCIWMALALAAALISFSPAHAHDGDHPPDMRVWRDVDGLFEIEGSFLLARDGRVQILKHGGSVVWVPLEKLSTADRAWVQNRIEAIRRLNGAPAESRPVSPPSDIPAPQEGTSASPAWIVFVMFGLVLAMALARRSTRDRRTVAVAAALLVITSAGFLALARDDRPKPAIQSHFEPFKDKLKFRSDDTWFYVESNGMPDHPMMIGITAWQQQVPMPQAYTGRNAWQIPLVPRISRRPVSAKKELFRGAIALAVNGVPIFNPIKNDGRTDTLLAGELDEYGGHCGRGDDYHYHIGPVHLEKVVGKGKPIGYALDGYPLYGFTDADGNVPNNLDEFNGRTEKDGYRYYSTKKYPYVNGGLRGVVTVRDDQIDPQPRAYSPRPSLTPLRGAKITGFDRDDENKTVTVKYQQGGKPGSVKYTATADSYRFEFTKPGGRVTTETYRIRQDGKRPPRPKKDGPPRKDDRPPRKDEDAPRKDEDAPRKAEASPRRTDGFTLSSPAFEHQGKLPVEFTGDGDGASPPLKWSGAPKGTKFYALQLWHKPMRDSDEVKSYWVITSIPATVTSLDRNSKGVGRDGINDKRRTGYDPMRSKGPGPKEYHLTLYALSAEPTFASERITRADLLRAIKDITLAESTLSFTYERKAK
ncbi:MAG: YHYH protein [Gemmataceae bacterium]